MAVIYKIYKNNNKKNAGFGKFYARAMHNGTTNLDDIAAIIERNCSMKKSDVKAVLTELVEVMTAQIQDSKRVKLHGLGTFKIGISTKGAESAAAFNPAKHIKNMRVIFMPEVHVGRDSRKHIKALLSGVNVTEMKQYTIEKKKKKPASQPGV